MVTGTITVAEKRIAVVKKYDEIIGRNKYSQKKRSYAFKKASDGKYYSDCSSSIALAYKYAGYPFYDNNGSYNPNTVGMYNSKNLVDVPVVIENGIIKNPEVLRLGDMLLFAGEDSSRVYSGYVGHVEMVGKISGSKITLYGHGSGTPRRTEMNAYCKKRYGQETNKTKLGHKGLIKVRRYFVDDGEDVGVSLHEGCKGSAVKQLQQNLMTLGYKLPEYGDDGYFGNETEAALKQFQQDYGLTVTGVYTSTNETTMKAALEAKDALQNGAGLPAAPDAEPSTPAVSGPIAIIAGNTVNIRSGPGKNFTILDVAKKGDKFKIVNFDEWTPLDFGSMVAFVANSMIETVKED